MTAKHPNDTPITDRLERSVEAQGNRDVPVRVYRKMRVLENDRARLIKVLAEVIRHVEDEGVLRVNNQCTLCYSYRKMCRDLLRELGEGEAA